MWHLLCSIQLVSEEFCSLFLDLQRGTPQTGHVVGLVSVCSCLLRGHLLPLPPITLLWLQVDQSAGNNYDYFMVTVIWSKRVGM